MVVAGLQVACEAHIQGGKVLGHPPPKKLGSYTDYICNRVRSFGERERAAQRGVLSPSWLHWSAAGACANSLPHPTRPPRLAGSAKLHPAGADTRHRHCDTPARRAGRPEGRALRPKAQSQP